MRVVELGLYLQPLFFAGSTVVIGELKGYEILSE